MQSGFWCLVGAVGKASEEYNCVSVTKVHLWAAERYGKPERRAGRLSAGRVDLACAPQVPGVGPAACQQLALFPPAQRQDLGQTIVQGQQLAQRAVAPSSMSWLGLVRHMADVERAWFSRRFGGQPDLNEFKYTTLSR